MKSMLTLALLSSLIGSPVQAYEVETGPVLVCDTRQQLERLVQLSDDEPEERALDAVNAEEHNPNACAVVNVTFVRGPQIGIARSQSQAFELYPVAVIGTATPSGYQSVEPTVYFTLVNVKELAV